MFAYAPQVRTFPALHAPSRGYAWPRVSRQCSRSRVEVALDFSCALHGRSDVPASKALGWTWPRWNPTKQAWSQCGATPERTITNTVSSRYKPSRMHIHAHTHNCTHSNKHMYKLIPQRPHNSLPDRPPFPLTHLPAICRKKAGWNCDASSIW